LPSAADENLEQAESAATTANTIVSIAEGARATRFRSSPLKQERSPEYHRARHIPDCEAVFFPVEPEKAVRHFGSSVARGAINNARISGEMANVAATVSRGHK